MTSENDYSHVDCSEMKPFPPVSMRKISIELTRYEADILLKALENFAIRSGPEWGTNDKACHLNDLREADGVYSQIMNKLGLRGGKS